LVEHQSSLSTLKPLITENINPYNFHLFLEVIQHQILLSRSVVSLSKNYKNRLFKSSQTDHIGKIK
jgi:hypothetical protein